MEDYMTFSQINIASKDGIINGCIFHHNLQLPCTHWLIISIGSPNGIDWTQEKIECCFLDSFNLYEILFYLCCIICFPRTRSWCYYILCMLFSWKYYIHCLQYNTSNMKLRLICKLSYSTKFVVGMYHVTEDKNIIPNCNT